MLVAVSKGFPEEGTGEEEASWGAGWWWWWSWSCARRKKNAVILNQSVRQNHHALIHSKKKHRKHQFAQFLNTVLFLWSPCRQSFLQHGKGLLCFHMKYLGTVRCKQYRLSIYSQGDEMLTLGGAPKHLTTGGVSRATCPAPLHSHARPAVVDGPSSTVCSYSSLTVPFVAEP